MGGNQIQLRFLSCLDLLFMAPCVLVRCDIMDNIIFPTSWNSSSENRTTWRHLLPLFTGSDKNELWWHLLCFCGWFATQLFLLLWCLGIHLEKYIWDAEILVHGAFLNFCYSCFPISKKVGLPWGTVLGSHFSYWPTLCFDDFV